MTTIVESCGRGYLYPGRSKKIEEIAIHQNAVVFFTGILAHTRYQYQYFWHIDLD